MGKICSNYQQTTYECFGGTDQNKVFIVGADGLILHYDGTTWSQQMSGPYNWLRRVYGIDSSNIYAAGDLGTVLFMMAQSGQSKSSGWLSQALFRIFSCQIKGK